MVNRERLLQRFLELVRIDGVSGEEETIAAKVASDLAALGFSVERDNCGPKFGGKAGNVLCRVPAPHPQQMDTVLLAAHLDVIESVENIEPQVSGDIVHTAGTTILGADDRAGVAILLEILQVLREDDFPHPNLEILFTVAEETGLYGAKFLELPLRAKRGIVLDSGGAPGTVVTATPSHYEFKARIFGRAAHAGVEPEKGISAIQIASRAIAGMKLGRIDEETTANIGYFHGGTVANAVPAFAEIRGEARSLSEEKLEKQIDSMKAALLEAVSQAGGRVEVDIKRSFTGYRFRPEDEFISLAVKAGKNLGLPVNLVSRGGGSDANVFNEKGIHCVNLAIGIRDDHSPAESISIRDMEEAAKHVLEILQLVASGSD